MAPEGMAPPDYPVNLILAGRRCLVVGGGTVAERKVSALLESGAAVTLISPELTPRLAQWALQERFVHCGKQFESGDAAGEGEWWPISDLDAAGLPTLYRKLTDKMLERDG